MEEKQIKTPHEVIASGGNVIKTRDDHSLILVGSDGTVLNSNECSWISDDKDNAVDNKLFRSRIEPWLTSLFQSEHLSLLCGSGITNAISSLAGAGTGTTMGETTFTNYKNEIVSAAQESAQASGR